MNSTITARLRTYAWPFFLGMGEVFGPRGNVRLRYEDFFPYELPQEPCGLAEDEQIIASDWVLVGDDIRWASRQFAEENRLSGPDEKQLTFPASA